MGMQEWIGFHGKQGHSCAEEVLLHVKEEGHGKHGSLDVKSEAGTERVQLP